MNKEFSEKELNELSQQLSCPSGENGLAVAKQMNVSNFSMTLATIQGLGLTKGQLVLELGHGNAGHLTKILEQAPELHYFGLEISELMKKEAERKNEELVKAGTATFSLYDGVKLPFDDNVFDVIFTVNTLYFWVDPIQLLNELHRVLKVGQACYITFAQKDFMEGLPFVKDQFTMYNNHDIRRLVKQTPFELKTISDQSEEVKSKTGEVVKRAYSIACLKAS